MVDDTLLQSEIWVYLTDFPQVKVVEGQLYLFNASFNLGNESGSRLIRHNGAEWESIDELGIGNITDIVKFHDHFIVSTNKFLLKRPYY